VYVKIINLIPFSISYEIDTIGIVSSSVAMGYVIGRFLRTQYFIKVLDLLKIQETGNKYLWTDLMDNNYAIKVRVVYENITYEGMLHYYESHEKKPQIALAAYSIIFSPNSREDYTDDSTKLVILDTTNAKEINIIYNGNSIKCNDLQNLCYWSKHTP